MMVVRGEVQFFHSLSSSSFSNQRESRERRVSLPPLDVLINLLCSWMFIHSLNVFHPCSLPLPSSFGWVRALWRVMHFFLSLSLSLSFHQSSFYSNKRGRKIQKFKREEDDGQCWTLFSRQHHQLNTQTLERTKNNVKKVQEQPATSVFLSFEVTALGLKVISLSLVKHCSSMEN